MVMSLVACQFSIHLRTFIFSSKKVCAFTEGYLLFGEEQVVIFFRALLLHIEVDESYETEIHTIYADLNRNSLN